MKNIPFTKLMRLIALFITLQAEQANKISITPESLTDFRQYIGEIEVIEGMSEHNTKNFISLLRKITGTDPISKKTFDDLVQEVLQTQKVGSNYLYLNVQIKINEYKSEKTPSSYDFNPTKIISFGDSTSDNGNALPNKKFTNITILDNKNEAKTIETASTSNQIAIYLNKGEGSSSTKSPLSIENKENSGVIPFAPAVAQEFERDNLKIVIKEPTFVGHLKNKFDMEDIPRGDNFAMHLYKSLASDQNIIKSLEEISDYSKFDKTAKKQTNNYGFVLNTIQMVSVQRILQLYDHGHISINDFEEFINSNKDNKVKTVEKIVPYVKDDFNLYTIWCGSNDLISENYKYKRNSRVLKNIADKETYIKNVLAKKYQDMISLFKKSGANNMVLIGVPSLSEVPSEDYKPDANQNFDGALNLNQYIKKIAYENYAVYVDSDKLLKTVLKYPELFLNERDKELDIKRDIMFSNDGLHPSGQANVLLANIIYDNHLCAPRVFKNIFHHALSITNKADETFGNTFINDKRYSISFSPGANLLNNTKFVSDGKSTVSSTFKYLLIKENSYNVITSLAINFKNDLFKSLGALGGIGFNFKKYDCDYLLSFSSGILRTSDYYRNVSLNLSMSKENLSQTFKSNPSYCQLNNLYLSVGKSFNLFSSSLNIKIQGHFSYNTIYYQGHKEKIYNVKDKEKAMDLESLLAIRFLSNATHNGLLGVTVLLDKKFNKFGGFLKLSYKNMVLGRSISCPFQIKGNEFNNTYKDGKPGSKKIITSNIIDKLPRDYLEISLGAVKKTDILNFSVFVKYDLVDKNSNTSINFTISN